MATWTARVWLLWAATTFLSGCFAFTPREQGDEMQRRLQEHEDRLASLEEGIEQEREQLRNGVSEAEAKVAELEQVLEEATKVVRRNSADLGAEVQELRQQLGVLEGRIAELDHGLEQNSSRLEEQRAELEERVESFARRAGVDASLKDSEIPNDKDGHLQAADNALDGGDHSKARALYREYVRRYPNDDRADDAQLKLGKSYLAQDRPASALGELRKVLADFESSNVADQALLAMADAFYELNSCSDAEAALKALLRDHPRSSLKAKARQKLRKVQKSPRGYCTN